MSVVDCCLEGICLEGAVFCGVAASGLGVDVREWSACELILLSDLFPAFVENIRVRRLVIEGFSAATTLAWGSAGVFPFKLSVLDMAVTPFWGLTTGELMADDVWEGDGEGTGRCLCEATSMIASGFGGFAVVGYGYGEGVACRWRASQALKFAVFG